MAVYDTDDALVEAHIQDLVDSTDGTYGEGLRLAMSVITSLLLQAYEGDHQKVAYHLHAMMSNAAALALFGGLEEVKH